jgi:hypothetical protein
MNDNHFAAGLVGFHCAVSLTNLIESEDRRRHDIEPPGCGVRRNLLKRYVRERKAAYAEITPQKRRS